MSSGERELRRWSFDGQASLYDTHRPSYPEALLDAVESLSDLSPGARLLELGSGTGIATQQWVDRGYPVSCLEIGPQMAAVARARFADQSGVEITVADFDTWESCERYRLVFSAQAFHWMDPETALPRVRRVLHPDGALALYWNMSAGTSALLAPIYASAAAAMGRDAPMPTIKERAARWARRLRDSGCFSSVVIRRFPWNLRRSADDYVALISTYSDHRTLPPATRRVLLAGIRSAIQRVGGVITIPQEAVLFVARGAPTGRTPPG